MPIPLPLLQAAEDDAPLAPQSLNRPLVLVGPTASGKTDLALAFARSRGGEVVSVDSRQVYKRLDAGTAKPHGAWGRASTGSARTAFLVEGIPHHLMDFLDPRETFDAARFASAAAEAVRAIEAAGRTAVFAGGAGMYLQAYFNGLDPLPPRAPDLRGRLEAELAAAGPAALISRLKASDPGTAEWAGANPRRLIRALEVLELTGRSIREQWTGAFLKDLPKDRADFYGVQVELSELDRRIEARTKGFWPRLLEETRELLKEFAPTDAGLRTLGYPEALSVVQGEKTSEEALDRLIRGTKKYARRQRSWFKRYAAITWKTPRELETLAARW